MNKSKNILITGASTGIGNALSKAFIESGYAVYGSVRKEEDAKKLQSELGEGFHPLIFDVTDHPAVDRAAEKLKEELGSDGLGGLVNNAGIAVGGPFAHIDLDEWRYQFEVNVIGMVKVTQAFLPLLGGSEGRTSEPGRILQISSVAGQVGMPFIAPYVGSKHAMEGISQSMRRELQLYGIDVIIIGPGAIQTPIWNKSADEEVNAKYLQTPFGEALMRFQNGFVRGAVKNGWSADKLANKVLGIFERKFPKTRYALVAEKFKNWTMPRLFPNRKVDRYLGKHLNLRK